MSGKLALGRPARPGLRRIGVAIACAVAALLLAVAEVGGAGPPFPSPTPGQYVYDTAAVFAPATRSAVQAQIQAIRDRTGAEIVVYTQVVGYRETTEQAEANALALMNQWGVGRKGFDDGLVILFDLDNSRVHGQVQLYAGPGYAATFLSDSERQAIYDNDMLPRLVEGDLTGALTVAMDKIDANATSGHAATLERARIANAIVGLVGTPVAFIVLVGWALWSWLRYGRDPDYLDDPSILMPAPPPDLTAPAGALVFDGRSSRHTLTTAMLDLASRDELAFRPEPHRLGKDKMGIDVVKPDEGNARIALNRRHPVDPAEVYALGELTDLGVGSREGGRHIDSTALLGFGKSVSKFDDRLETYVTQKGWFREKPKDAVARWRLRGGIEAVLGVVLIVVAFNLPSDGLLLIGAAVLAAGIVTLALAYAMPARTLAGATIRAMLAAYRRTLEKTFAMSRSMNEVVDAKVLPWLETPDQAVVWGVALGLREDVQSVLERSADDVQNGRVNPGLVYIPHWYGSGSWDSGGGGGGGFAPGLFSSSAVPNFGGMVAAIGTIGNSPASSGSGGFGGGGGGGGGGGAGGGF
jgi:uncharacterized membrane protein YgcG